MSSLLPVIYSAETLLFERSHREPPAIRFRIIHRFQKQHGMCQSGEEVFAVQLLIGSKVKHVPLSLALRLVFDYLARHSYVGQSASQIAAGMQVSFYRNHAANSGISMRRKISRSSVKEYVHRIRRSLAMICEAEGIAVPASRILASQSGEGNEVLYCLSVATEWVHAEKAPADPLAVNN